MKMTWHISPNNIDPGHRFKISRSQEGKWRIALDQGRGVQHQQDMQKSTKEQADKNTKNINTKQNKSMNQLNKQIKLPCE